MTRNMHWIKTGRGRDFPAFGSVFLESPKVLNTHKRQRIYSIIDFFFALKCVMPLPSPQETKELKHLSKIKYCMPNYKALPSNALSSGTSTVNKSGLCISESKSAVFASFKKYVFSRNSKYSAKECTEKNNII